MARTIDLGLVKGAVINDAAPSAKTTYSGQKIESELSELKNEIDKVLPAVTDDDAGKFLRVSSDGVWVAETLPVWEGGDY